MDLVNNDKLYNEYENLEKNLVDNDKYENLKKDFVNKDEVFYNEYKNLVGDIKGLSDIKSDNNNEPLFKLNFNMLAKAKQFTQ
ncbi:hypothetical protein RclHR1_11030001 [Rhizophagus clarus]|uniref:Uncharacterized protein n=1 Tax=Rhizophagus clarus TaxID=94130 RepID=A0A2Z6QW89_9GLOM|nr:hypothetical protein RclHR1_11030001 [Rhizophagus clarus]GES85477.1 hypothetical protein GLOIN_2v1768551 [Rhizophagus clarus]